MADIYKEVFDTLTDEQRSCASMCESILAYYPPSYDFMENEYLQKHRQRLGDEEVARIYTTLKNHIEKCYTLKENSHRDSEGVYYNGFEPKWMIQDIEALGETGAAYMAEERLKIKGYTAYLINFGGYFGYSCVLFYNGRQITHAGDYQLHHREETKGELKALYVENLEKKLYTDEEIGSPLHDYDDYCRRENYLRNIYSQRQDCLSIFIIAQSKEEQKAYEKAKKGRIFDPISYGYYEDKDFVIAHVGLYTDLLMTAKAVASDYEYQKQAFISEMFNHEYAINWQADYDTLSAFGNITYKEDDIEAYFNELDFNEVQRRAYRDARGEYYAIAERREVQA